MYILHSVHRLQLCLKLKTVQHFLAHTQTPNWMDKILREAFGYYLLVISTNIITTCSNSDQLIRF